MATHPIAGKRAARRELTPRSRRRRDRPGRRDLGVPAGRPAGARGRLWGGMGVAEGVRDEAQDMVVGPGGGARGVRDVGRRGDGDVVSGDRGGAVVRGAMHGDGEPRRLVQSAERDGERRGERDVRGGERDAADDGRGGAGVAGGAAGGDDDGVSADVAGLRHHARAARRRQRVDRAAAARDVGHLRARPGGGRGVLRGDDGADVR